MPSDIRYVVYIDGKMHFRHRCWQTAYAYARKRAAEYGEPAIAKVYKSNGGTIFTGLAAFDSRGVNVTRQISV